MSITEGRPSWIDIMEKEEELMRAINIPELLPSVSSEVNPTPSKHLAAQIQDFHVVTPLKIATITSKNEPIPFNIDDEGALKMNEKKVDCVGSQDGSKGQNGNEGFTETQSTDDCILSADKIDQSDVTQEIQNVTEKILKPEVTKCKETTKESCRKDLRAPSGLRDTRKPFRPSSTFSEAHRHRRQQSELGDFLREKTDEASRKRTRPSSSSSSVSSSKYAKKSAYEIEKDPDVLERRLKQINYGKNTVGYERYLEQVPENKRTKGHPRTPPMHLKYSRRAWDGLIKIWRQELHFWDPDTAQGENEADSEIESTENSLDESLLLTD